MYIIVGFFDIVSLMLRSIFSCMMYSMYSVIRYKYRGEIYVNLSGVGERM
jgi:hypothetical protein